MKTGEVIKTFKAKDGRSVILRAPKWEDLHDFTEFINSLVEEGAEIAQYQNVTIESEADWLGRQLADIEKGDKFILTAEVDGKVVANSQVNKGSGYSKHVGGLGIAIKKGYRDIGIGTEMMEILISQADKMGVTMLMLTVYSTNKRALHVYRSTSRLF